MIMSHCGISVVINVRLYDSQDELKTVSARINPSMSSDCELHCTQDQSVGYHEKYMNSGNNGVFKKNSVCSSTHPHGNSGATSVYIEKATYQIIPSVEDGIAGVYGWYNYYLAHAANFAMRPDWKKPLHFTAQLKNQTSLRLSVLIYLKEPRKQASLNNHTNVKCIYCVS